MQQVPMAAWSFNRYWYLHRHIASRKSNHLLKGIAVVVEEKAQRWCIYEWSFQRLGRHQHLLDQRVTCRISYRPSGVLHPTPRESFFVSAHTEQLHDVTVTCRTKMPDNNCWSFKDKCRDTLCSSGMAESQKVGTMGSAFIQASPIILSICTCRRS